MQKSFRRDIRSLNEVFDFLESCVALQGLAESAAFKMKFAVEEVFTNFVKYNSQGPGEISIAISIDADNLVVQLIDYETVPFDITKKEDVNVNLPIEQRNPGGLGIHLVKAMLDNVEYDHTDSKSTITLTMKLEG
jgi:anti-sigma regulatory factor (Ser/Thr protein kinase)